MMGSMLRRGALTADTTGGGPPSPSWTLDFSSGSPWANETDYTYSSLRTAGTYVNSSGYIAPNAANLLLYSEQFNQNVAGAWTVTNGVTIGSNVTTSPDNTTTADELIENTANSRHNIGTPSKTVSQSLPYTLSCYVKANNRSYCALTIYAAGGTGARFCQVFDLTGSGSLGSIETFNSPTGTSGTITAVGNGWFRVTATMDSQTNTSMQVTVSASNSATPTFASQAPSYLGAGNSAIYVWGAQLEQASTASTYSATTTSSNGIPRLMHNSSGSRLGLLVEGGATNLLLQSQAFDNTTTWGNLIGGTGVNPVRTANNATAPDGTMTADTITFDVGSGVLSADRSMLNQTVTGVVSGGQHTLSFWIRSPSGTAQLNVRHVGGVTHTLVTATTTWQRVTITETDGGGASVQIGIRQAVNGTVNSTATVELWGAQVEAQAFASSYIPTTTQSVTRAAETVHVPDSKITSWGDPGALVVHFYPPSQSGTLLSTDDAATAQVGIEANSVTDVRAFWSSGSTASETMTTGLQKAAHYWKASASKFCLNGGPVRSGGNDLVIGNTDFVTLGAEATESGGVPGTFSQYANCVIRKVEFYSGTLTDAELQAITT